MSRVLSFSSSCFDESRLSFVSNKPTHLPTLTSFALSLIPLFFRVFAFSFHSILGPIPLQRRNELINHLAGWSYRPYVLSQDDLYRCNCLLFEATLSIEGIWEMDIDQGSFPSLSVKGRRSRRSRALLMVSSSPSFSPSRSDQTLPLLGQISLPLSQPLPR